MATLKAATSEVFLAGAVGAVDTDLLVFSAGAAQNDVIRMAKVQAGTRLVDATLWNTVGDAGASAKVGWAYVDGSASDDDELIVATSIAAAARTRANSLVPGIVLAKDAYLIVTITGAALAAGHVLSLQTLQKFIGNV